MQLLLDLPEISPELSKAVETDPIRLREWLISLPSSDVVEAGRAIFDALASLNRIDLGVETRITLLGEYETMLDVLAGGFEAAYASAGLPMKDRAKQAATLYKNLWLEMAMGWKVALVTRMEKRGLFSNNKVDPHFVQRILYCFWRFYRINSRLFMPMPKGLWGEIHQMFRLGAENKFLDEPTEPKNRSIATTYKRLLLLSLADPLRFAPLEQDKVVDIVENYGHLAHFLPLSKSLCTAGHFLIELDSDKPPYFIGHRLPEEPIPFAVQLETSELARYLQKTEAAIETKAPLAHDRSKILARLQILRRATRQWSISPQRTYQRIPSQTKIDMVLGLRAVVAQLNNGKMPLPRTEDATEDFGLACEHPAPSSRPQEIRLSSWQVINESPGGYAVRSLTVSPEQVRAGDIVALRAFPEAAWMVATVRWLQQDDTGELEMGLQILSSRAIPALIRPTISAGTPHHLPALLLPEITALKQPARIAASKGTYTPLRELAVLTPEGESKIRATRLIDQQMSYDLFDFQPS